MTLFLFEHSKLENNRIYLCNMSHLQYTESIEARPLKSTKTSFKIVLNKAHPNNSKREMDNFFKGASLVLELTLISKVG